MPEKDTNAPDSTSCDAGKRNVCRFRGSSNRVVCGDRRRLGIKSPLDMSNTLSEDVCRIGGFLGGMSGGDRDDMAESRRRQDSRKYADVVLLRN